MPTTRAVVYLDDGRPVGVLLWNVPEDDEDGRDAARGVLRDVIADPAALRERLGAALAD